MNEPGSSNNKAKLPPEKWPRVSVIVITKGNHTEAEAAVTSILATDYPEDRRETIVVEETNNPQPVKGPGVRYVTLAVRNLGVGFARNQGLRHASGEIVAFTDDDCLVDKDWLKELVRPLQENPNAGATAGAVLVTECGAIGQCENILGFPGGGVKYVHASQGRIIPMTTFSTCNCAIRRSVLDDGLCFHEGFQFAGEDQLLSRSISAKHLILYNPNARVRHKPRDSFTGVYKWLVRRGQAEVETARYSGGKWKHFAHAIYISPLARLLTAAALFVVLRIPIAPVFGILFLLYYASVLWRCRWARTYYPSFRTLALLPVVKTVMDIGMNTGILKAIFVRKRVKP